MSTRVRMFMQCVGLTALTDGSTQVNLRAVYSPEGNENRAFADATPAAELSAVIAKDRPAAKAFAQGENYYVDIENVVDVQAREGGVVTRGIRGEAFRQRVAEGRSILVEGDAEGSRVLPEADTKG